MSVTKVPWTNGREAWSTAPTEARSIFDCVRLCAEDGGVPACPMSSLENAGLVANLTADDAWSRGYSWLGLYQDIGAEPADGWHCVEGADVNFTNWRRGEPNDGGLWPKACAMLRADGDWEDEHCNWEPFARVSPGPALVPCMCTSGSARTDWPTIAEGLTTQLEAALDARPALAMRTLGITLGVWLLLVLVLGCANRDVRHVVRGWASRPRGAVKTALQTKIEDSMDAAAHVRVRVSFTLLVVGWLMLILGLMPFASAIAGTPLTTTFGPPNILTIITTPGLVLLLLSLLPTDRILIYVVAGFYGGVSTVIGLFSVFLVFTGSLRAGAESLSDPDVVFGLAINVLLALANFINSGLVFRVFRCASCTSCSGCGCFANSPRASLRMVWQGARFFIGASAVLSPIRVIYFSAYDSRYFFEDPLVPGSLGGSVVGGVLCILLTARRRGRFIRWLGGLGAKGSEQQRAAAVAGLCGRADPLRVLDNAKSLFRCIPVMYLEAADLAGSGVTTEKSSATPSSVVSTPPEQLAKKTEAAVLGEVTAFVSHSWRDEDFAPGKKFEALTKWAREDANEGKRVTCWLDKACIKQDSIDEALACLPVFLAGCERMLVIAGKTYTTRLWCAAVCPHGR